MSKNKETPYHSYLCTTVSQTKGVQDGNKYVRFKMCTTPIPVFHIEDSSPDVTDFTDQVPAPKRSVSYAPIPDLRFSIKPTIFEFNNWASRTYNHSDGHKVDLFVDQAVEVSDASGESVVTGKILYLKDNWIIIQPNNEEATLWPMAYPHSDIIKNIDNRPFPGS